MPKKFGKNNGKGIVKSLVRGHFAHINDENNVGHVFAARCFVLFDCIRLYINYSTKNVLVELTVL